MAEATQQEKDLSVLDARDEKHVRAYLEGEENITLKSDATRDYEIAVVDMVKNNEWKTDEIEKATKPLIEAYKENKKLAYAAFYALCSFYRRKGNENQMSALLNQYREVFNDCPSYEFLDLMCQKMLKPNDWSILAWADRICEVDRMGKNYGVLHCYAEYVAEACENKPDRVQYFIKVYMGTALARIMEAIKCDPDYAKFYITRARLYNILAIYGEEEEREAYFSQGQTDVRDAIAKETNKDRQMEFRVRGVVLQSEYYEKVLGRGLTEQREELERMQRESSVKNLEFLSFFSAVIGLLIAGTQMVLNMAFLQAVGVLIALTGCLLTAFGALGFILHSDEQRLKVNKTIVIIGIVVLAVAIVVGLVYGILTRIAA